MMSHYIIMPRIAQENSIYLFPLYITDICMIITDGEKCQPAIIARR